MRYLLMIILTVVLVVLVVLTVQILRKSSSSKKIYKAVRKIFQEMEQEYENFLNRKLSLEILETKDLNIDTEQIRKQAYTILQPYLEALSALISANNLEQLGPMPELKYFKNLYFLTEKFLRQTLPLSSFEKDELKQATMDAIDADISKRLIQLQSGF